MDYDHNSPRTSNVETFEEVKGADQTDPERKDETTNGNVAKESEDLVPTNHESEDLVGKDQEVKELKEEQGDETTDNMNGLARKLTMRKKNSLFGKKMSNVLSKFNFDNCEADIAVSMAKMPSMKTYAALNQKLRKKESSWMHAFLDEQGMEVLLEAVASMSQKRVTELSDAMTLLECVACIRQVMNSKQGIEYFIANKDAARKLTKALDTNNSMVKKHIFELLSGLCMYSKAGYDLALDALEVFKISKSHRYRFSLIMRELRDNDATFYQTSTLTFINCLILGEEVAEERNNIRREFISLGILDTIQSLQDVEDFELQQQIDVFIEEKHNDEEILDDTIHLDNPNHLCNLLVQRTMNTPQSENLVNILRSLAQIDEASTIHNVIWESLDDVCRRLVLIDKVAEVENLLYPKPQILPNADNNNNQTKKTIETQTDQPVMEQLDLLTTNNNSELKKKRQTLTEDLNKALNRQLCTNELLDNISPPLPGMNGPPPPPPLLPGMGGPPPPLPGMGGPPPPPPLPGMGGPPPPPPLPGMGGPPPPPPLPGMGGPPPPPLPGGNIRASAAPQMQRAPLSPLTGTPLQENNIAMQSVVPPKPKKKMRTINWTKVTKAALQSPDSVWFNVLQMKDPVEIQYIHLEELFSQKIVEAKSKSAGQNKKVSKEINLLDTKDSMRVNIFLKQFKGSNEHIVELISTCNAKEIGLERLKGLVKVIPEKEQVTMLKAFDGDRQLLGNAEKFYDLLIKVPEYSLRLDAMLLSIEFSNLHDEITPKLKAFINACTGLKDNQSLMEFLRMVLHTGNFINAGGYAGSAVGFQLSSLLRVTEVRSNKPRQTLLHYLVEEVVTAGNKHVLQFADELDQPLTEAARLSFDGLVSDVNQLSGKVSSLERNIEKSTDDSFKKTFQPFLKDASCDVNSLKNKVETIQELSKKLASHFCEEESSFKLEECLSTFKNFCDKVRKAQEENVQRHLQEERAAKRKEAQEQLKKKQKKGGESQLSPASLEDDGCIIDKLLVDIRKGFNLRKTSPVKNKSEATNGHN